MSGTNSFNHNNQVLNFWVNNLGANQLAYELLREINRFYRESSRSDVDVLLFYDELQKYCLFPRCAVMHLANSWGQEGTCVATNAYLADKLLNTPGPSRRLFYLWDLEWLRGHRVKSYESYLGVYTNPELEIVCRSETHREIFENNFNRKVDFVLRDNSIQEWLCILEFSKGEQTC